MEITRNSSPNDLPKVLILNPLPVYTLYEAEFSQHFHFIKSYESPVPLPISLAAANSAGVTVMLIGGYIPINAKDILDHLPSLRCIVSITAGLNHIDLQECHRRGIAVTSAGDTYSDDCADFAVALLIDILRKVSSGDHFVRRGDWKIEGLYCLGRRLSGKTVGIIGLGSIGCRIAKRLEAFGCRILYNSRKEKPSVSYTFYSDVTELATNSDVIIISCALTDQTRHMISTEVLSALGKEGVIVNIARGPIIDEKELVRFLVEGKIAGAGLDVFEKEPNIPKELIAMENVVLSPHAAFLTHESFRDIFELVKGNLEAFFSNKPLLSPVMDV
ncbi:glyoxylate/hydroxypyruvate reductase HPR3 isoform X2 [Beta vulgaris subsp. vulgaris]|uniref:glyoxylate/hydroxypyruvate reductase HPR3 isoform X2 n=1 Tax=Beta vulgaris subsp. vulgaris TaxID=3555 RepID=UPI000900E224|nr:glyoxylate/hydroxypyruvate reductase HPR3 isoform X2 [Beta vulgaris subsp. vulgaris]